LKTSSIVYWLDNSLYLNITNECSNDCYFCIRKFWKGVGGFNLTLEIDPSTDQIIRELRKHIHRRMWEEVVFCGFGEPLSRLDTVLEVTRWIRRHTVLSVRVDTNGHGILLNPKRNVVEELRKAGVSRLSVSLNAHDSHTYQAVCKPRFENAFQNVLDFIRKAKEVGIEVEVTAVQIPEIDIRKMREMVNMLGVKFRLRRYIPCVW
jgi:TatD family-associated radical SAM protein